MWILDDVDNTKYTSANSSEKSSEGEFDNIIVRQAERADFSELMICQIFSTDVKKTRGGSQLYNTIQIL